jgi:Phage integrase, N-terminal SAM-like domain
MAITLKIDTEKAGRAIPGGKMARRGFQQGSLFQRGARKKVWVARWWEDVIQTDGTMGRLRRSEVIGPVAQFPSRRLAMQVLSQKLASINKGTARPQSIRTFATFVAEDWSPVVLPTLKYATQKHYRYMLDVHLIPAFGKRQIRDITREELQGFLSRKLGGGLSWETVHYFKCGLSKILARPKIGATSQRISRRKPNFHDGSTDRNEWCLTPLRYGTWLLCWMSQRAQSCCCLCSRACEWESCLHFAGGTST